MNFYKTIVSWPPFFKEGAHFYTYSADEFEAETIVNALLKQDYNWENTKLNTNMISKNSIGKFNTIYYLDNLIIKIKL